MLLQEITFSGGLARWHIKIRNIINILKTMLKPGGVLIHNDHHTATPIKVNYITKISYKKIIIIQTANIYCIIKGERIPINI